MVLCCFQCFNFHIFLKILFRRGMGVETRTKPSHKVAQNVSNDLGWPNAVKILPIRLCVCVVRLQTTMYYKVTRFASLFFVCVLFFFIFVNSVVIFSQMRVFFFLFCISIMTLLFVFAWLFHLSSTTTYSLSDGYHNITQWKAQESTDLACKTKVFVLCFGRSVNTAHLPAHPCSSTALVWL